MDVAKNVSAHNFINNLDLLANKEYAKSAQKFFKTGKGEYGEGDIFIGVRVPDIRIVCKRYKTLELSEVKKLLYSPTHEHRLAAVILLRKQYETGNSGHQQKIFDLYMKALADGAINNWDIIDISAGAIVGEYSRNNTEDILYDLAKQNSLWSKRVAIIASSAYIHAGNSRPTMTIAKMYLDESHDLIHKATGWMLREVGKQITESTLTNFLDEHASSMPRTMLRYACEKLDQKTKKYYYAK